MSSELSRTPYAANVVSDDLEAKPRPEGDAVSRSVAFSISEVGKPDKYFGFEPGRGVHDIHMNQGSVERFKKYNGVWQDGGMLIHFGSINQWVAIFLAFQSQCWHTDDVNGHCLGTADQPAEEKDVVIIAAMVNPPGHDPGKEKVLLLNTTADPIDLGRYNFKKYS